MRSQKITLSLLGRDVSELKKSSSDLLSELESSVVYINENVDKHSGLIKTLLEGTAIEAARETKDDLSRQMEEMIQKVETWQVRLRYGTKQGLTIDQYFNFFLKTKRILLSVLLAFL